VKESLPSFARVPNLREAAAAIQKFHCTKVMPIADFQTYCAMLDRARAGHFALPAVNVTSLSTANAVLRGLAETALLSEPHRSSDGGASETSRQRFAWH
jgi:hypothetical protein